MSVDHATSADLPVLVGIAQAAVGKVGAERAVVAIARGLADAHRDDVDGLARFTAEALVQLAAREPEWPPAAADIRLAHDQPGYGG